MSSIIAWGAFVNRYYILSPPPSNTLFIIDLAYLSLLFRRRRAQALM